MNTYQDIRIAFVTAVAEAIDVGSLIPPGSCVVVAVSGGADSVAMLAALRELAGQPGRNYRLIVAHLNHCLRPEAAEDARFVRSLARRLHLPCHIVKRNVPALARRLGQGIEHAARIARYEFLRNVAVKCRAGIVAVAHHADDNVETVLYRLFRGTGLHGLSGMAAARPLLQELEATASGKSRKPAEASENVLLVRPMLALRRSDIESFCRAAGLTFRTDSTNADVSYRRNFIRQELLPLLRRRLNPQADLAVLRLARSARIADGFLLIEAAKAIRAAAVAGTDGQLALNVRRLKSRHPAVVLSALRLALEEAGVPMRSVGAERLEEILSMLSAAGPDCVNLPEGWTMRRSGNLLRLSRGKTSQEPSLKSAVLSCPGTTQLPDGSVVSAAIIPFDTASFTRHCRQIRPGMQANVEFLDADCVSGPLSWRLRCRGDVFTPLGAPGRQSVSNFLTNLKLPGQQRRLVRCICDSAGIIWLCPLRIAQRARVSSSTRRLLRLEVTPPR